MDTGDVVDARGDDGRLLAAALRGTDATDHAAVTLAGRHPHLRAGRSANVERCPS
ncbi:hypothetical protein [Streptomyces sp. NPDC058545]|uniref:hypothetical protein n=1 Tax=Streptomyces sp. NPDC058545 TaxID=3346544 RepID=UPI00364E6EF3